MSYPTIGMTGIVPDDNWSPEVIENLLRKGSYIFAHEYIPTNNGGWEHSQVYYKYDEDLGKFVLDLCNGEHLTFDTFVELAVYIAFMGQEFL